MRALVAVGAPALIALGAFAYWQAVFLEPPLRLTGVVSADKIIVTAQVGGALRELAVDEGTWLTPGDRIALIERDELQAQERQQLAKIRQLEALLEQSREEQGLARERAHSGIATAQAHLRVAESERVEATVFQRQSAKDLQYNATLHAQGLTTTQEQERLATQLEVAESQARSAEDGVRAAQAELDLAHADARAVEVMQLDVEQTQALLEQAQAELAQLAVRLGHTEIRSPVSGLVSLRIANQGEVLKPGDPIVTVLELDEIWVRAEVEESHIGELKVGQSLDVELASGERVQGQIVFIAPEADFATQRDASRAKRDIRTFSIKVALANPEHRIHPGMTAYVLLP